MANNTNDSSYPTGVMNDSSYPTGVMDKASELEPAFPQAPINTISIKPFYEQSSEELDESWKKWGETNPGVFIPPVAGAVGSFLLKKLAGLIADRALKGLMERLFPGDTPITMEQILKATEEMMNKKIEETVRERVEAELLGLTNVLVEFEKQITKLEAYVVDGSPAINEIENNIHYLETGEYLHNPSPTAIIDSINIVMQMFASRIPQFQVPTWKVQLLPLFAQAANLHLFFIRDIIDNAQKWNLTAAQVTRFKTDLKTFTTTYSNYVISTYKSGFDSKFPNSMQEILSFRTFMTLGALDYVPMWALLRFDKVIVNSSSNIYSVGRGTGYGTYQRSHWDYLNKWFQGRPNKILTSLWAYYYEHWNALVTQGGTPGNVVVPEQWLIQNMQMATGYLNSPELSIKQRKLPATKENLPRSYDRLLTGYSTLGDFSGIALGTSTEGSPRYIKSIEGIVPAYGTWIVPNKNGNYGNFPFYNFPTHLVRNVVGLMHPHQVPSQSINLVDGPRNLEFNDGYSLNGAVSTHNRTGIAFSNANGSIKHSIPYTDTGNNPSGLTISALHYEELSNNDGKVNLITIHERFGNFGDAVNLPASSPGKGSYIQYRVRNRGHLDKAYKVYVKISTMGDTTIRFWGNGALYGEKTINTRTANDGINDNGQYSQYVYGYTITLKQATDNIIALSVLGAQVFIGQIILVPAEVTPIYE